AYSNAVDIIENGRLRAKIENEGFNTQKNLGYGLQHKYSQTSELATKNYYTCLQIGHMINQLLELRPEIKALTKGRETIKNLWQFLIGLLTFQEIELEELTAHMRIRRQVRFD
ncbi:MAG: transposase, partial [Deltaproteobacteria bacterium]|nr:transposase [Deltaproteobacteria bacterium]